MRKSADVGLAVTALSVTHRYFDDFEIQLRRAEQQVEVAKWIKIAEIVPARGDSLVVTLPQDFGAAQRIFDRLAEKPAQQKREEFIAQKI